MRVLFLCPPVGNYPAWKAALAEQAPNVEIVQNDYAGPKDAIDVAIVLSPPPGFLKQFSNLKAVFSLGAGAEHLWSDPELPNLPLVRLTYSDKRRSMSEWILYAVLHFHREFDRCARAQRRAEWERIDHSPLAPQRRVGVLGLGDLGAAAALELRAWDFAVSGWSRRQKNLSGVDCFSGREGLFRMLPDVNILVGLLPLTPDTKGILNADVFTRLPRGAAVVNAGRGGNLVTNDLVGALDSGHLSGAFLDVTDPEPLPTGDPLWSHPKITITPHIASYPPPQATVRSFIDMLHMVERGKVSELPLVDRDAGY